MRQKDVKYGSRRVQNKLLEAFGALLAAMWAQGGRQECSRSLLGAARGPIKFMAAARDPPRGEKYIDVRVVSRAALEAPGRPHHF